MSSLGEIPVFDEFETRPEKEKTEGCCCRRDPLDSQRKFHPLRGQAETSFFDLPSGLAFRWKGEIGVIEMGKIDLRLPLFDDSGEYSHRVQDERVPDFPEVSPRKFIGRKESSVQEGHIDLLDLFFDRALPGLPALDIRNVEEFSSRPGEKKAEGIRVLIPVRHGEGRERKTIGQGDVFIQRNSLNGDVPKPEELIPGSILGEKTMHAFRSVDGKSLCRHRFIAEEHQSRVMADVGMGHEHPIEPILTSLLFEAEALLEEVKLNPEVRRGVHQKGFFGFGVDDAKRGDEAGEARLFSGPPAVDTITSRMR